MSASEWMQLFVHPDDAEIQRLSELTGRRPEVCLASILRWFWHVDRKQITPQTGMGAAGFHRVTAWQNKKGKATLAEAMQDKHIGWLELGADGTFIVPKFEEHFGRNAKRRAMEARRKTSARHADKSRTDDGQTPDEIRTESAPTTTTTTTTTKKNSSSGALRSLLKQEGFNGKQLETLLAHPNCTLEQVQVAVTNADILAKQRKLRGTRQGYIYTAVQDRYERLKPKRRMLKGCNLDEILRTEEAADAG